MDPKDTENTATENADDEARRQYRQMERPDVINADNDLLHPITAGPFRIGCIDEVNGPGAVEMPEFIATRHELIQIAKYWYSEHLHITLSYFMHRPTGSWEIRVGPFANRRLYRIEQLVGEDALRKALDDVQDEFSRTLDPRVWQFFREGRQEDYDALHPEAANPAERKFFVKLSGAPSDRRESPHHAEDPSSLGTNDA